MEYEQNAISGNTKALIVLLHGLGSNGDDLFSLVPYLSKFLPDCHFYSPDAIEEYDMAPFGYQWFSLQDRSHDAIKKSLENAIPTIYNMVLNKAHTLNLSIKDVILFGFSQGSMVSLYLSLTSQEPFKAVVGFSGRLFKPDTIIHHTTPICLIHGAEDDVVPAASLKEAETILMNEKMQVETHLISHIAHSIDIRGIEIAVQFMQKVL